MSLLATSDYSDKLDCNLTFGNILSLIQKQPQDPILQSAIVEFLNSNKEIFTSGRIAFTSTKNNKSSISSSDLPKSFNLRSITYKNTLPKNTQDCVIEIAEKLKIDSLDSLSIVINESNRIPSGSFKFLIEDDNAWFQSNEKSEILSFYISKIMKEQRYIIKISDFLIMNNHNKTNSNNNFKNQLDEISHDINSIGYKIIEIQLDNIEFIESQLNQLSDNSVDSLIRNDYNLILLEILNYIAHLIIFSEKGFTKKTVSKWFKLMEKTKYLSSLSFKNINEEQLGTIESLSTLITLMLLDLDFNFGSLTDDSTFMNDPTDLKLITQCILNTQANSIILYAWSIILHRKHIVLTNDPLNNAAKNFVSILSQDDGPLSSLQELYSLMAEEAANLDVSTALLKCHKLLSYDPLFLSILGSFVIAYVPYVQPTEKITDTISTIMKSSSNKIIERFFSDPATEDLLTLSRAKMPYSLNSFISLISINSNLAIEELRSLSSYMEVIKGADFFAKYVVDEKQPELIKLTHQIDIIPPYEADGKLSLLLKEGTKAQILPGNNKSDESLVMFLYDYCGWSLLGRILRNLSVRLNEEDSGKLYTLNIVFKLLTKTVLESNDENIDNIFNSMNAFIDEQDIIDITFRILDQILNFKDLELLSSIINFISVLSTKGFAYRAWSYFYKSNLFSFKPDGGLALDVLGKTEITSGRYNFTISLIKLSSILCDDCLKIENKVTLKLKSQVITYFVSFFLQIFENFANWKYVLQHERFQIGFLAVDLFDNIMGLFSGVDEFTSNEKKINSVFYQAFEKLSTSFFVHDIEDLRSVEPILISIDLLGTSYSDNIANDLVGRWNSKWIQRSFQFCKTLINVRSSIQPRFPSSFEMALFSKLPNLVNIYLFDLNLRQAIMELLNSLVGAKWTKEPPSMLTHLHQTHTHILLKCLSVDMSNKYEDFGTKIALYDFFSAVMENNQEGLAIVFITGKDIKESIDKSVKKNSENADKFKNKSSHSLLKILKNDISVIENYPSNVALHMLHAIALTFGSWTTVNNESSDDFEFIKELLTKMDKSVDFESLKLQQNNNFENCYQLKLVSKIVEIISLYLYVLKSKKCEDLIIKKLNSEDFISKLTSKFKIAGYEESLQENVREIFHKKWPDYHLEQFMISSNYKTGKFGVDSIYNFELMDSMLGNDPQWPELKNEIETTSINIQLTSVQIDLAKSYGALITCFCKSNPTLLDSKYLQLANDLLKITHHEGLPSELFDTVFRARIELAFLICFAFSNRDEKFKANNSVLLSIIVSCSRLLESKEVDLNQGLMSLSVNYYKPLLRILLISINMISSSSELVEYSATFVDIFKNIVCKSINILFNTIKNSALSVPNREVGDSLLIAKQIDDILLILSITKSFLKLKFTEETQSAIATGLINSGAYRALAGIYASAHLIKVNSEQVFADYALTFLYEFSKNKYSAEKLISNGLFHILIESPISLMIQKGRISPYGSNHVVRQLHHIWVDGLLPIVLTLFGHFSDMVLVDVCRFVLAFGKQIKFTIQSWMESESVISIPVIEETAHLVMLAKILNMLDTYNIVANDTGSDNVKLIPGLDTVQERKLFVNALNYLLSHPKYLTMKVRSVNGENIGDIDSLLEELKLLKESLLE